MRRMGIFQFIFMALGVIVVLGLAVALVQQRYQIRTLFVEHERSVDIGRRLADDQADLLLRIRKAALPSAVAQGAEKLGLEEARGENTVSMVMDAQHRVTHLDFDLPPPPPKPEEGK
ncbi:MAG: hypothetical protein SOR95_08035 [Sutterella sp.]|nr:hypothetical protein [Sutterella sp.]